MAGIAVAASPLMKGDPVADHDDLAPIWRKSSRSNSAGCLEVAFDKGVVLLRDSKNPNGMVLSFSPEAWTALIAQVRGSTMDARP
jgi:hypothetical protein